MGSFQVVASLYRIDGGKASRKGEFETGKLGFPVIVKANGNPAGKAISTVSAAFPVLNDISGRKNGISRRSEIRNRDL